jgi:hypothetical protein
MTVSKGSMFWKDHVTDMPNLQGIDFMVAIVNDYDDKLGYILEERFKNHRNEAFNHKPRLPFFGMINVNVHSFIHMGSLDAIDKFVNYAHPLFSKILDKQFSGIERTPEMISGAILNIYHYMDAKEYEILKPASGAWIGRLSKKLKDMIEERYKIPVFVMMSNPKDVLAKDYIPNDSNDPFATFSRMKRMSIKDFSIPLVGGLPGDAPTLFGAEKWDFHWYGSVKGISPDGWSGAIIYNDTPKNMRSTFGLESVPEIVVPPTPPIEEPEVPPVEPIGLTVEQLLVSILDELKKITVSLK